MQIINWQRMKGCEGGACSEVAFRGDQVLVRSSERPREVLTLTRDEWQQLRTGDFGEES